MGAEIGATCSLFPYDHNIATYLKATGREAIADLADRYAEHLCDDPEIEADPERFFDRVIEIDLSKLEPHLVGPAHARPRPSGLGDRGRRGTRGLPDGDLGRARRFVHELLVRGHRPRRATLPGRPRRAGCG